MAVQRKSQKNQPGQKKAIKWTAIVAVVIVVIIVAMCIISFSGLPSAIGNATRGTSGSTVASQPINDGDHVGVYFATNCEGKTVFSNFPKEGQTDAGSLYSTNVNPNADFKDDDYASFTVKIGDEAVPYKINAAERNAIAKALSGKNYGDMTGVGIGDSGADIRDCTADELKAAGCDMETLKVGDVVPMAFTYKDEKGEEKKYCRIGVVKSIADDKSKATLNFGSDSVIVLAAAKYR